MITKLRKVKHQLHAIIILQLHILTPVCLYCSIQLSFHLPAKMLQLFLILKANVTDFIYESLKFYFYSVSLFNFGVKYGVAPYLSTFLQLQCSPFPSENCSPFPSENCNQFTTILVPFQLSFGIWCYLLLPLLLPVLFLHLIF